MFKLFQYVFPKNLSILSTSFVVTLTFSYISICLRVCIYTSIRKYFKFSFYYLLRIKL